MMVETVARGVKLYSRTESGLTGSLGGNSGALQRILRVHHGADISKGVPIEVRGFTAAKSRWVSYQRYHIHHNLWSDIGYSFGVGADEDPEVAHILTGRGWGRTGAHTEGHNSDLGVCLIGYATPAVVTPGVKRAFDVLRRAKGIVRPAYPHSATSQTACPGSTLRTWVLAGMPLPTTPPAPTPPPPSPPPPTFKDDEMITLVRRADEKTVWASNGIFRRAIPNPSALNDLRTVLVRHFHYHVDDTVVREIDAGEDLNGVFGPDISNLASALEIEVEGPEVSQ